MSRNGDRIRHKETDDGSVQTEHNADINLEEGNDEAEYDQRDIIANKSPSLPFFSCKMLQKLLPREETQNRHD